MFTQCTNCEAIFSVNMREVTVSKGLLRCGECNQVFDSSKNLSTTMQSPFVEVDVKGKNNLEELSEDDLKTVSTLDDWQKHPSDPLANSQIDHRQSPTEKPAVNAETDMSKTYETITKTQMPEVEANNSIISKIPWSFVVASLLVLLFLFQIGFNYRHLFLDTHKYEPDKIQMLNHNVFAHPIEKDVLLISAAIKNTAEFDQPFPTLEVRLTNSKSELVALRRFSPDEYLDNYSSKTLLTKNRSTSIKLKIKDPGSQATRFQFDFL